MHIRATEELATASGDALRALGVGLLIGMLTWLAIDLTRPTGGVTVIWAAGGVLAGILLTSSYRLWPIYIFAAFVANLLARALYGDPWLTVAIRGTASTLEACIVVYALRFLVGNVSDPANLPLVGRVAMSSTLIAVMISAFLVAATATLSNTAPFTSTYVAWFASHMLGMVMFATIVGIARELGMDLFGRPGRRWKFVRTMALVAATAVFVFSQSRYPLLFLIYPPLLLAVFRHHFAGWAIGITLVAMIAIVLTAQGTGPMALAATATEKPQALLLQIFIAVTCLTTLPVGFVLSERGRLAAELRNSEQRLRAITDNLPAMVAHVDAEQKYTFVNAAYCRIFGLEPTAVIGHNISEILSPQLHASILPRVEAALRGEPVTFEGEIEINGRRIYRQASYVPDIGADGSVRGFYSMAYDISELQAAKQELARVAQHDYLTGLANRYKFNERLDLALAKCDRHHHPIALVYLDIDFFKRINDSYGHAAGDALLAEFAARLQHNLRATDLAARLGGDEFAVLIEDVDSAEVPETIARKLCAAMRPACMVDGVEIFFSASIGVGFCRTPPTAKSLAQLADRALYEAKAAGRDTYRVLVED